MAIEENKNPPKSQILEILDSDTSEEDITNMMSPRSIVSAKRHKLRTLYKHLVKLSNENKGNCLAEIKEILKDMDE